MSKQYLLLEVPLSRCCHEKKNLTAPTCQFYDNEGGIDHCSLFNSVLTNMTAGIFKCSDCEENLQINLTNEVEV